MSSILTRKTGEWREYFKKGKKSEANLALTGNWEEKKNAYFLVNSSLGNPFFSRNALDSSVVIDVLSKGLPVVILFVSKDMQQRFNLTPIFFGFRSPNPRLK
jgi:hypothetical protein